VIRGPYAYERCGDSFVILDGSDQDVAVISLRLPSECREAAAKAVTAALNQTFAESKGAA